MNPTPSNRAAFIQPALVIAAALAIGTWGLLWIPNMGWPTLEPFVLILLACIALTAGIWAGRRLRRPAPPWLARNVAACTLPILLGCPAIWFSFTGVESRATRLMTWSDGTPPGPSSGRHVVLRYVDHPHYTEVIYSDELAAYLQSLGKQQVQVEFRITRDFGFLRGYSITRVSGLTGWKSSGGHSRFEIDYRTALDAEPVPPWR